MSEHKYVAEIAALIKAEISQPFYKAWLGCVLNKGALSSRPRYQPFKDQSKYKCFRIGIPAVQRIHQIVDQLQAISSRSGCSQCNAITIIVSDDGSSHADYTAEDVVKCDWGEIYDAWDKKYLAGLQLIPEKMPLG